MKLLYFGSIVVTLISAVNAQNYDDVRNLLAFLFNESRYNKDVRPLQDQADAIEVNFTLYVNSIEYLDVKIGELVVGGYFLITWQDHFLSWNPAFYGGKQKLSLQKGSFWKPNITLANSGSNELANIDESEFSMAFVDHEGMVTTVIAGYFRTKCNVDTKYYPLDQHTCFFRFFCSNHNGLELVLKSPNKNIIIDEMFTENNEWVIKSTNTLTEFKTNLNRLWSIPYICKSISLQRRPAFEIVHTCSSVTLLMILNLCTCFVHPDSGERLTFAISLYLAVVVTLSSVISTLASNSTNVSITSYMVLILNVKLTIGIIWSIIIVTIAKVTEQGFKIPKFLEKRVINHKRKLFFQRKEFKTNKIRALEKHETELKNVGEEAFTDVPECAKVKMLTDISGMDIARYLDKVYFHMFCSTSLIMFAVIVIVLVVH